MGFSLRILLTIVCLLTCTGSTNMAQIVSNPDNPFSTFNQRVYEARNNSPAAVKKMVDDVFDVFSGLDLPAVSPLRDRTYRAEMAYRQGKGPLVSEAGLARAVDNIADRMNAPSWVRTNQAQLHLFRTITKRNVPQLIGLSKNPNRSLDFSDQMSPAEAMLIVVHLAFNKTFDVNLQVPADEWVRRMLAEASARNRGKLEAHEFSSRSKKLPAVSRSISDAFDGISQGLTDDRSAVSKAAGEFLTTLGFPR